MGIYRSLHTRFDYGENGETYATPVGDLVFAHFRGLNYSAYFFLLQMASKSSPPCSHLILFFFANGFAKDLHAIDFCQVMAEFSVRIDVFN